MRLFASPTSPYARKARAVIIEKGLEARVDILGSSPLDNPADLQAANPLGKIPALVLDDGRAVFDSPVICACLDGLTPAPRLIPEDPAARIDCLTREALADGIMDAAFSIVMERRRPEAQQSPYWLERWVAAIRRAIAHAAAHPRPTTAPDLGDLALACALDYVDFRLADLAWDAPNPALRAWLATMQQRPSLALTAPPKGT